MYLWKQTNLIASLEKGTCPVTESPTCCLFVLTDSVSFYAMDVRISQVKIICDAVGGSCWTLSPYSSRFVRFDCYLFGPLSSTFQGKTSTQMRMLDLKCVVSYGVDSRLVLRGSLQVSMKYIEIKVTFPPSPIYLTLIVCVHELKMLFVT
jgi:hypothetical protein